MDSAVAEQAGPSDASAEEQPLEQDAEERDPEDDEALLAAARQAKERGNAHFKSGELQDALECYTEAIEFSAATGSEEVAVFFANRAAVFAKARVLARSAAPPAAPRLRSLLPLERSRPRVAASHPTACTCACVRARRPSPAPACPPDARRVLAARGSWVSTRPCATTATGRSGCSRST